VVSYGRDAGCALVNKRNNALCALERVHL
jgi:hypothetical protein